MGFQVYAGVFPMDSGDFAKLEEAIERVSCTPDADRELTIAQAHPERPKRWVSITVRYWQLIQDPQ
jgi:hypothetical protein